MAAAARHTVELAILRQALTESEAYITELRGSNKRKREDDEDDDDDCAPTQGEAARPRSATDDDCTSTQGEAARPRSATDDDCPPTQGEAAPPRPQLCADDDFAPTQGVVAAPRVCLAPATETSRIKVAFTGVKSAELQRLQSIVKSLGGELEEPSTLTPSTTHVVVAPRVGAKTTPMSVWAALSMKLLVSPAWLDASAAQGSFLVNGGGGSSSSDVPAELVAVRGIANPLDHKSVYLTDAFREQHKDNKTVIALLMSAQPILLGASTVGLSRATAEIVFCTDTEYLIHQAGSIPGLILRPDAEVYTFPTFLARMVPGHGTVGPSTSL